MNREQMMQLALNEIDALRKLSFVNVDECEIVQRGNERYALWCTHAYLLHDPENVIDDEGNRLRFEPVIIDNKAFFVAPDEGKCGVLHWHLWEQRRGKPCDNVFVSALNCRWMRQDELNLSNEEIFEHIVEEVEQGETPLTGLHDLG